MSYVSWSRSDSGLKIRLAEQKDAVMVTDYFSQNRAFLKPWEPLRPDSFYTVNGWSKKLIQLSELHYMSLAFYFLLIEEETGDMVGTISFSSITRFPLHSCNVGYSLAEKAQGKGYMTRGMKMACQFMFEEQNLHRIQAAYMPHNQASESVLKRLGFEREGYAKEYLMIDGQWQDHVLTALVNQAWSKDGKNV